MVVAILIPFFCKEPISIVLSGEEAERFIQMDKNAKFELLKSYSPDFNAANIFFCDSGEYRSITLFGIEGEFVSTYEVFRLTYEFPENKSDVLIKLA